MNRTYTLVITLLIALMWSDINGQVYLVNEGFESTSIPASGWYYTTGVTHATSRPRTGLQSARFSANDHSIRTPLLTTPLVLNFWLYRNPGGGLNVQVQWQTDPNASTWNTIATIVGSNNTWVQYSTDILTNPLFTSKTNIYIRIRSNSGSRVFFVDDFTVTSASPVPDFSAVPNVAETSQAILFTDNSTGTISTWQWNFGNGAIPPTANTQGPHSVTYSTPGFKTVSLTLNGSFTETKTDFISITSPVVSSSATYNSGDLPTDYNFSSLPGQSACPGFLSVNIPNGAIISSLNVSYQMTGQNYGWLSEQRSQLRCTSPGGLSETTLSQTSGNVEGSYLYTRSGLDIANAVTGGGAIQFELHAGRTWGGSGCNTQYNKVDNNTWTITVFYTQVPYVDFTASPLNTETGETVTFTDNSGGGTFSSWLWDFGDGAIPPNANTQGPHLVTYSTAGYKTVSLTLDGTYTETKTNYIAITDPDWLHWDDGLNFSAVGRTTAGILQIAARFEPSDLLDYPSHEITKIKVFIGDLPTSASVKIWQGVNQAGLVEYVSQPFTPVADSWVIVDLIEPYQVNPALELWFGVEFQDPGDGVYPAGIDEFTEADGKSNLYRLNNNDNLSWATLTSLIIPLQGDWNLQAWLLEFSPPNPFNPPRYLTAEIVNGNDVSLNWFSPEVDDGFELYTDFALSFGNWSQYDLDEDVTFGSAAYNFLNEYYTGSFIIFQPAATTPPATDPAWQAHTGIQFAACFAANPGPNNDWLITPQLKVAAGDQLSFYHKSVVDTYGLERFKVGISTTGANTADFTIITPSPYLQSPIVWTQYTYDLSSYENQEIYIAINVVSDDAFIFMLDDFVVTDAKGNAKISMSFEACENSLDPEISSYQKMEGNSTNVSAADNKSSRLFASYKIFRNSIEIGQSADFTYLDENLSPGTYFFHVTAVYADPYGESDPSNLVEITIGEGLTWFGSVSSEWENIANWNLNILPNATSDVLIPVTPNDPLINSPVTVNDLTIETGASLEISPIGTLTANGTLINSQGESGLIVLSSSAGTGSLITSTPNLSATFQRYFKGDPETWHMLSSPMTNQPISGDFTPSGTYADGTGYDFYTWYEPDTSWVYLLNTEYPPTWSEANGTNNFTAGKGYLASYQATNPTLEFAGLLNVDNVSLSITRSNASNIIFGANLIGNPYPSSIDWKAASGWNRSDLESSGGGYDIWIWNDEAFNYGVYNSASENDEGTLGVSRFIAPNQGFFVLAAQNGSISFGHEIKSHQNSGGWLKSTRLFPDIIYLTVESGQSQGVDEVLIGLENTSSRSGTPKRFSFFEGAPSLFIPLNGQFYSAINGSNVDNYPVVPLSFKAGRDDNYTLTSHFEEEFFQMVVLEDKLNGTKQDLKLNPVYSFSARKDDSPSRFIMQFKPGNYADPHDELPVKIYVYEGILYVDLRMVTGIYNMTVIDMTGRSLLQSNLDGGGDYQIETLLGCGVYIIDIKGEQGTLKKKVVF